MAEDAAAADLISDGRLQLGISRGSPEPALRGAESFGYIPAEDMSDADLAREKTALFRAAIGGAGVAQADPSHTGMAGRLPIQPQQIAIFRETWSAVGWKRQPRVSVSRSVIPIVTDEDRALFGGRGGEDRDTVGYLDGGLARFGRSYTGEPDMIAQELADDVAVEAADTLLLTVPNQLGVEYNARMLETIANDVAPAIGWSRAAPTGAEHDPEAERPAR